MFGAFLQHQHDKVDQYLFIQLVLANHKTPLWLKQFFVKCYHDGSHSLLYISNCKLARRIVRQHNFLCTTRHDRYFQCNPLSSLSHLKLYPRSHTVTTRDLRNHTPQSLSGIQIQLVQFISTSRASRPCENDVEIPGTAYHILI